MIGHSDEELVLPVEFQPILLQFTFKDGKVERDYFVNEQSSGNLFSKKFNGGTNTPLAVRNVQCN